MSEWRFLCDENIDPKTVTYLRKEGFTPNMFVMHYGRVQTTRMTSCRTHENRTSSS